MIISRGAMHARYVDKRFQQAENMRLKQNADVYQCEIVSFVLLVEKQQNDVYGMVFPLTVHKCLIATPTRRCIHRSL